MKRIWRWLIGALVVALLAAGAFVGGILFQHRLVPEETPPVITSEQIMQEIAGISEFASLEYRYTNVGRFENQRDFYGWNVPLTTKSFIVTYDGAMKLGIRGDAVGIEVVGGQIRIRLPEATVLSHEIYEDTLEVLDQTQNIFNQIQIEDYATFAVEQKQAMEEKARENGLYRQAQEQAEAQLGAFLQLLPGIREEYEVVFSGQGS